MNFRIAENGIYFMPATLPGAPQTVQFYAFADRSTRIIARLDKPACLGFALSPDGRSFLYSQLEQQPSDLMLVENFR